MVYEEFVGTFLILSQAVNTNIKPLTAASNLMLVQLNRDNAKRGLTSSQLTLKSTANVSDITYSVSAFSVLSFTQSTKPRVFVESIFSVLNVRQSVLRPKYERVASVLVLTQAVDPDRQSEKSAINLTQTATVIVIRHQTVIQTISFDSIAAPFIRLPNFTQLKEAVPVGTTDVRFVFGSTTLHLPRPQPANTQRFDFTRINRRTRGGDLILYSSPMWPKTKTLGMQFILYGENRAQEVLQFLELTAGKRVNFFDHYGNTWLGFIMTPTSQIVQDDRMSKSINIEFQGVKT